MPDVFPATSDGLTAESIVEMISRIRSVPPTVLVVAKWLRSKKCIVRFANGRQEWRLGEETFAEWKRQVLAPPEDAGTKAGGPHGSRSMFEEIDGALGRIGGIEVLEEDEIPDDFFSPSPFARSAWAGAPVIPTDPGFASSGL